MAQTPAGRAGRRGSAFCGVGGVWPLQVQGRAFTSVTASKRLLFMLLLTGILSKIKQRFTLGTKPGP